ncbi:hypothetical protein PQR62_05380 [Herbaspirillum lusitanum]|uniref:Uncharacterized protein n=1 Tax=Herbaspirillum lusitanum TaxID=213312 RepID=A0ABW9A6Q4_9BURK
MSILPFFNRKDPIARARSRTIAGLVLSILIHVGLFLVLRAQLDKKIELSVSGKPEAPLQVTFIRPEKPKAITEPKPQSKPQPAPKPKQTPTKSTKPKQSPRPTQTARPKPDTSTASRPTVRESDAPSAITPAPPEQDMSSMLNAARERRRAAEESAAQENAAAYAAENPSANDIARANIAFQEQRGRGTNGVFEIISKGPRVAQYSFRGWTKDQRRSQQQTISVDAGMGGNVELAVVDSMIALIRKYYSGDFNWDSQRLGRVVVLSARPSDTKGLQAFLMQEFFRSGG